MEATPEYSVLLVEDSPTDARFVFSALENSREGRFHPKHVGDLSTALSAMSVQDYDVILLDLGLPDAHGIEAVRRVCSQHPNLPVVVLTSNSSDEIAMQAIENGAQDFLAKHLPFPSGERLARTLHYAIARRGALPHIRESYRRAHEPRPRDPEVIKARSRNIESELDEVKGRLQVLTMQSDNALANPRERELICAELATFIEVLQLHFSREEVLCLTKKEALPAMLHEPITHLLEEHASLHKKFSRLLQKADTMPILQLKRETLAALCCFIEHEIAENGLMKLVEN